ncbi:hypothetical protein [Paracoccus albus]|nr:hypothetical protein [Paracoccus albus]WBU60531.1 hypothetical protein PAF20_00970 [Paracoccus albus]
MRRLAFALLFALSACGVDGAPERPDPPPGVTFTGDARIGVRADGL